MGRLEVHTTREAVAFTRRLFHRTPLTAFLFAPQMVKVHSAPAVRFIRARATVEEHLSPETLNRVAAPTLLLWGASEKLLPLEMLAYFRRYLPSTARIEVIEGVGHVPQMERPKEIARRLAQFAEEAGVLAPQASASRSAAPTSSAGTRPARPMG
jgi:pimeloyl-ACP methyl ester carboxylesterase